MIYFPTVSFGPISRSSVEMENSKIFSRIALCRVFYCLRCPCGNDRAAVGAAAGTHINDIVRIAYHIKIMFNDDHGCSMFDQCLEDAEQSLYIQRMQADGRFVENEDGIGLCLSHLAGKLQPLGFAAGKTGRFFAKSQISETEFLKDLQPLNNRFHSCAGFQRGIYIHSHVIRQGVCLPVLCRVPDMLRGFSVPGTSAFRTGNVHVRQKLYIETDHSGSVTDRATQPSGVIGEIARFVSCLLCIRSFCIYFPELVVYIGIGGDGGTDVDADRRGVDQLYLLDAVGFNGTDVVRKCSFLENRLQRGNKTFQDQSRFSGT